MRAKVWVNFFAMFSTDSKSAPRHPFSVWEAQFFSKKVKTIVPQCVVFNITILPHALVYNKRRILFELVFRTAAIVQFKDVNGHFKYKLYFSIFG